MGPQPLLFMVHGLDQPFNTKENRSEIARHLSKRYHRQRKLPLNHQSRKAETKVVHYPVTFHHGGQRLDVSTTRPGRKKKVRVKKEAVDYEALPILVKASPDSTGSSDVEAAKLGLPAQYAASSPASRVPSPLQPGDLDPTAAASMSSHGLSADAYYTLPVLNLVSSGSWRGDPFGSLPIRSDGCESAMIDYYWQHWAPDADLEYRQTEFHEPHRSIIFPAAMDEPVLLQSLVAMCRVFWLREYGVAWQNEPEYLKLRKRAVALVQAKLDSPTFADDSTLLAIVCLNSIEMMASNAAGVISHARGLNLILGRRHGEKNESITGRYIKAQAKAHVTLARYLKNRIDSSAAARASTSISQSDQNALLQTVNLTPTYPSHPYSLQMRRAISALPPGFSELAMTGLLSRECISILNSLTRKAEEWIIICMPSEVDSERKACYQLLESEGRTNTEYWLLYGIICFCNQFPDRFDNRSPFFNIALKCFEGAIQAQQSVTWSASQPWLLWVALVTTGALEICARPIEGRFVILDTILDQCSNAHSWDWLEHELRKFLWTDGLLTHWRQCWEEGLTRWQERQWNSPAPSTSSIPSPVTNRSPLLDAAASPPSCSPGEFSGASSGIGSLLRDSCNLLEANRQSQAG